MTPQDALAKLLAGNRRYAQRHARHPDETISRRLALVPGQQPFAAIVGCADSRVPPEIVFDEGLGDLFTIRIAGAILDAAVLASVEYAAVELNVPLVFVLGHEGCGAVKAALEARTGGQGVPGHIATLTRALEPALSGLSEASSQAVAEGVKANVRLVTSRLRVFEPILAPLVSDGRLLVAGGFYSLSDGLVTVVDGGSLDRAQ